MRIFYFVGKSGAKQRHKSVTCDVFLFRKALQKTFSTGWTVYETLQFGVRIPHPQPIFLTTVNFYSAMRYVRTFLAY